MSLTRDESAWMDKRDELSEAEKEIIDESIKTLEAGCRTAGIPAAIDDRAASLEAAMIKYLFESRR